MKSLATILGCLALSCVAAQAGPASVGVRTLFEQPQLRSGSQIRLHAKVLWLEHGVLVMDDQCQKPCPFVLGLNISDGPEGERLLRELRGAINGDKNIEGTLLVKVTYKQVMTRSGPSQTATPSYLTLIRVLSIGRKRPSS